MTDIVHLPPDLSPLTELRVDVDPVLQSARMLAPMIDPDVHPCGSVPPHGAAEPAHPESNFSVVGDAMTVPDAAAVCSN